MGYKGVRKGYIGLEEFTGDYKVLQGVTRVTEGYKGLQEVTGGYKVLQGVTEGYNKLQGL